MPDLIFPISPDGLAVGVTVGLSGPTLAGMIAAGQTPPNGIALRALIDTGADATSIEPSILARLGARYFLQSSMTTASGTFKVNCYRISLCILDPQSPLGAAFVEDDWFATEFIQPLPGIQALLGMDLVRAVKLNIDGPGNQFTLSF